MNKQLLAQSYDLDAQRRASSETAEWKLRERAAFLERLFDSGKQSLLEIGAGTGRDSLYFQENGLQVTATDLSNEMIRHCRDKGLEAHVMDFYNLKFADASFDAVYALNCLLHVPKQEIDRVLTEIKRVMKPGGLFFMGVYGGCDSEGIWDNDWCEPKRLFTFYADDAIRDVVRKHFAELDFHTAAMGSDSLHFQALLLQKES